MTTTSVDFFTPPRTVALMCDLLEPNLSDTNKTIFDPGCGTGNFLIEILKRRLRKTPKDEAEVLKALSKLYAADINSEYISELRQRIEQVIRDLFAHDFCYHYLFWPQFYNIITNNIFVANLTDDPSTIKLVEWHHRTDLNFLGKPKTLQQLIEQAREHA